MYRTLRHAHTHHESHRNIADFMTSGGPESQRKTSLLLNLLSYSYNILWGSIYDSVQLVNITTITIIYIWFMAV